MILGVLQSSSNVEVSHSMTKDLIRISILLEFKLEVACCMSLSHELNVLIVCLLPFDLCLYRY